MQDPAVAPIPFALLPTASEDVRRRFRELVYASSIATMLAILVAMFNALAQDAGERDSPSTVAIEEYLMSHLRTVRVAGRQVRAELGVDPETDPTTGTPGAVVSDEDLERFWEGIRGARG